MPLFIRTIRNTLFIQISVAHCRIQMIDYYLDDSYIDGSFRPLCDILNALDGILDDLLIINDLSQRHFC